ncbi:uncharacterized protein LOC135088807 [Scylla paramamosain]|uniref:uncharacterized protein LOC135088807 n=1 Tax=Scylla paramamosain TaxID=85552 RepID=UPI003082750F
MSSVSLCRLRYRRLSEVMESNVECLKSREGGQCKGRSSGTLTLRTLLGGRDLLGRHSDSVFAKAPSDTRILRSTPNTLLKSSQGLKVTSNPPRSHRPSCLLQSPAPVCLRRILVIKHGDCPQDSRDPSGDLRPFSASPPPGGPAGWLTCTCHRNPALTALHWAAKQGRTEVVKLLAGTHHVEINARSGYTPLHIAAMYNRTEVFDLLVHYGADLNMRDYSGKKPRTYNTIASTVSQDTQRRIVQRRNSVKDAAAFLRIGSLNVKVRKTTEAFNSLLSRDVEAKLHRAWGSSDSLPDAILERGGDREGGLRQDERRKERKKKGGRERQQMGEQQVAQVEKETKAMPPPKFGPIKKRKLKKDRDAPAARPVSAYSVLTPSEDISASMQAPSGTHVNADSDSDSAYGFGSEWH